MTTEQSTPPTNYVPATWVKQFSKVQLQWLAEQLRNRQEAAHQDAREARNQLVLATSRLNVLEAANSTRKAHK